MKKLEIKRIAIPEWAGEAARICSNFTDESQICGIEERINSFADKAVREYLNDPRLASYDEEDFPSLSRMSGKYYIKDVRFVQHLKNKIHTYQISVECRFLDAKGDDYLGLEVWILYNPENMTLSKYRNTDSSAI